MYQEIEISNSHHRSLIHLDARLSSPLGRNSSLRPALRQWHASALPVQRPCPTARPAAALRAAACPAGVWGSGLRLAP